MSLQFHRDCHHTFPAPVHGLVSAGLRIDTHESLSSHSNVTRYLPQQDRRYVSPFVKRHGRAAAVCVPKLPMRTTLTDLDKSQYLPTRNHFPRLQYWKLRHG